MKVEAGGYIVENKDDSKNIFFGASSLGQSMHWKLTIRKLSKEY